MLLKTIFHGAGNTIRYEVDYSYWLEEGTSLSAGTAVLSPDTPVTDVVIGTPVLTASNRMIFLVTATVLKETFTIDLQVTNSREEVKNDTLNFDVVAP